MLDVKFGEAGFKDFLDEQYYLYNQPGFIADDPVCIPHEYTKKQDIEIAGMLAAVMAWGQRKTIINKCREFLTMMGHDPHNFLLHHQEADLKPFEDFRHRTFNGTDALYFIYFLRYLYQHYQDMEEAFVAGITPKSTSIEGGLIHFRELFVSLDAYPTRSGKHMASPAKKSACKRLNMFLRWMVRRDEYGIDFGIWPKISPALLVCPCDVHVERIARHLGLIQRPKADWETALELTHNLKSLDADDPVKYDYALFGIGCIAPKGILAT